jgi:DNA-binding CsgD family transcriptional regulator
MKIIKQLFIVWLIYMLGVYIYSEAINFNTNNQTIEINELSKAQKTSLDFKIDGNTARDSIDYLIQLAINNKIEHNRLNGKIQKLKEYKNIVLLPLSFPLRMFILFIIVAITGYFLSRNRGLIRNKIQNEFKAKQRKAELQNSVLLLSKRNEDIDSLIEQLVKLKSNPSSENITSLIIKFKHHKSVENNWLNYLKTFESINPNFFSKIEALGLPLTNSEKRLCAFISQDLTINQIATIINVNPNSVEKARYRLRKKLNLTAEQNLNEFIKSI